MEKLVKSFFLACRKGDLDRVQHLVEEKEVDLNSRDEWDSTGLYYACLCGYEELTSYLLEKGARCVENTFDGERCFYAALTDRLRRVLKRYRAVTSSTVRRDRFSELMRRLLEEAPFSDFRFIIRGTEFPVHRCILAARCRYFAEMLETKWANRNHVNINNVQVSTETFSKFLEYLYTGKVELRIEETDSFMHVSKRCHLDSVNEAIEQTLKRAKLLEIMKRESGLSVRMIEVGGDVELVKDDMIQLLHASIPPGTLMDLHLTRVLPFADVINSYPDIGFNVDHQNIFCHKAFFCGRSDYFRALISDHFSEGHMLSQDSSIGIVPLREMEPHLFAYITSYIYTDRCTVSDMETGWELLHIADMLLLMGLKTVLSSQLAALLTIANVVNTTHQARLVSLSKLEDECAAYMADHLDEIVVREDFAELVLLDARNVCNREETDTIDIIDQIRYFVQHTKDFSELYDAEYKLRLLDELLEELNLDA